MQRDAEAVPPFALCPSATRNGNIESGIVGDDFPTKFEQTSLEVGIGKSGHYEIRVTRESLH